jgi:hypothetical protein
MATFQAPAMATFQRFPELVEGNVSVKLPIFLEKPVFKVAKLC